MLSTDTLNPVFADRPVTIFAVMSALANEHDAINLGQGFPDEDGPAPLLRHAADAILTGNNQYAPVQGIERLRSAVAEANKRFYGLEIDPVKGVLVTSGASEALAASFLALLKPGDEAILFAPYYDSYAPMIEAAGARPVVIDLQPPHWRIDADVLRAAITPETRVIALNTPHNPLGRIISEAELSLIAEMARSHNITVVCDEVYEHLVFDGVRHRPLMTFDDMQNRCVRIGSAGKTFSLTGWRVGYVSGAPPLIEAIMKARQFMGYTTPAHLQSAVAEGLGYDDAYYNRLAGALERKRDMLASGLTTLGFSLLPCEGTYFLTADIRGLTDMADHAFCAHLTRAARVTAVPLSAFYHHRLSSAPTHYIRFCFCKKEDVLREALARLETFFRSTQGV